MNRRLPDFIDPVHLSNWLVAATVSTVVAGTLAISYATDDPVARPAGYKKPPTSYEWCLLAANHPDHGFATEVCEPLSPFYDPSPAVTQMLESERREAAS